MPKQYRILDLFCGAGGAGMGYRRAGFKVIGVDIETQPGYPGHDFVLADAIALLEDPHWVKHCQFDAIHASPPCQNQAAITKGTNAHLRDQYPDLYPQVKALLADIGLPYVIENPSARPDVVLCGEMFGLGVIRHRKFELGGWTMPQPKHVKHRGRVRGYRHGQWYDGPYIAAYGKGGGKGTVAEMQEAMGMPWVTTHHGLTEAIPPAYTQHIGAALASFLDCDTLGASEKGAA
jgi:hypothetical protein